MTRHRVDRAALVVALACLVAAVGLALLWTTPAGAATNRVVLTGKATHAVYTAQVRIWRHNLPRARAFRISCRFDNVRGHGARRRGEITNCTFRAYRRTDYTGRLLVFPLDVTVTPRYPSEDFEDGSGWITYDSTRSLYMNPRSPH